MRIKRGLHVQTTLENFIDRVVLQKRIAHIAREIVVLHDAVSFLFARYVERERSLLGFIVLFLGDVVIAEHAIEHEVAAR